MSFVASVLLPVHKPPSTSRLNIRILDLAEPLSVFLCLGRRRARLVPLCLALPPSKQR